MIPSTPKHQRPINLIFPSVNYAIFFFVFEVDDGLCVLYDIVKNKTETVLLFFFCFQNGRTNTMTKRVGTYLITLLLVVYVRKGPGL